MKITICGSIGFYKEMESARDELVKHGHEVKIPELALEVPQEFGGGEKVYFGQYIEENGVRILTDPGTYSTQQSEVKNIDFVLITHEHADHFHIDSLKALLKNN